MAPKRYLPLVVATSLLELRKGDSEIDAVLRLDEDLDVDGESGGSGPTAPEAAPTDEAGGAVPHGSDDDREARP